MSRPDAVYWRNTNHLNSLEFSPGRLVYNRIPRWISMLLLAQVLLGAVIWCAARALPINSWISGKDANQAAAMVAPNGAKPAPAPAAAPAKSGGPGQVPPRWAWLTRIMPTSDASVMLSFAASQLAATVLVQLVTLPLVRRALRRHAGGLKDVFDAIRAMAAGVTPRPRTARRPGESGFLALAFNDMMARLAAQRKELIEANETLEKKVAARTQELREAAEKLEKMAQIDALTGLPNRRALMDQGEQRVNAALRMGTDLVCLMIDLDDFKLANDTLGHAKGDEVIRIAADTLRDSCRPDDLPARLGGDEFTLLMATQGLSQASMVAQRLQEEFRKRIETALKDAPQLKTMPSMSIGITSLKSADAARLADLMNHADTALYEAKRGGKARAQVYHKGAA
jgi:diguanylate cyclase (GGDEF)-like protein